MPFDFAQGRRTAQALVPLPLQGWIFKVLFAAGAMCLVSTDALAQRSATEYDVKAAYLLNFGKFVRIAGSARGGNFNICIIGQDPFAHTLDDLTTNEAIDGRPVHVLRFSRADGARVCSLAYLAATDAHRLERDIAFFSDADVLTVSDAPDFLRHGGMIQFVQVSNHVRFAVNLDAVRRSHIVLSSELLRVAVSITGGEQPGTTGGVQP